MTRLSPEGFSLRSEAERHERDAQASEQISQQRAQRRKKSTRAKLQNVGKAATATTAAGLSALALGLAGKADVNAERSLGNSAAVEQPEQPLQPQSHDIEMEEGVEFSIDPVRSEAGEQVAHDTAKTTAEHQLAAQARENLE